MPSTDSFRNMIDSVPELKGAGVTYISPSEHLELRKSSSPIANHILIEAREPVGKNTEFSGTYRSRLANVSLSCGGAGLNIAAATVECGSMPLTVGLSVPLCALSTAAATISTWQCGVAIGQLYNHSKNPALADELDNESAHPLWHRINGYIEVGGYLTDGATGCLMAKDMVKLVKFRQLYNTSNMKNLSVAELKKIYKDLAHTVDDKILSNAEVRNFINRRGYSRRHFNSGEVIVTELKKRFKRFDSLGLGVDVLNTKTEALRRTHPMHPSSSKSTNPPSATAKDGSTRYVIHLTHKVQ